MKRYCRLCNSTHKDGTACPRRAKRPDTSRRQPWRQSEAKAAIDHIRAEHRQLFNRYRNHWLDHQPWCASCGIQAQFMDDGDRLELDHIKPLAEGGSPTDFYNTQLLCSQTCHPRKTQADRARVEAAAAAMLRSLQRHPSTR